MNYRRGRRLLNQASTRTVMALVAVAFLTAPAQANIYKRTSPLTSRDLEAPGTVQYALSFFPGADAESSETFSDMSALREKLKETKTALSGADKRSRGKFLIRRARVSAGLWRLEALESTEEFEKKTSRDFLTGGTGPEAPEENFKDRLLGQAAMSLRKAFDGYPAFRGKPALRLLLGRILLAQGRDNAELYFKRVLTSVKRGTRKGEAHLGLGEYHFQKGDFDKAVAHYKKAAKLGDDRTADFARYKRAWARVASADDSQERRWRDAVKQATREWKNGILRLKKSETRPFSGPRSLFANALVNDLITAWSQTREADAATTFFKRIDREDALQTMLARSGMLFEAEGKQAAAAGMYTSLLEEGGEKWLVAYAVSARLARLYKEMDRPRMCVDQLQKMKKHYIDESKWSRLHVRKRSLTKAHRRDFADLLAKFESSFETQFKKDSDNREAGTAARDVAALYVDTFPERNETTAMRLRLAVLQEQTGQTEKAVRNYEKLVKTKSLQPRVRTRAAGKMVSLQHDVIGGSQVQGTPQKRARSRSEKLGQKKKYFVELVDLFRKKYRQQPKATLWGSRAAKVHLNAGNRTKASKRFLAVFKESPGSEVGAECAKLALTEYQARKDWKPLADWALKFQKSAKGASSKTKKFVLQSLEVGLLKTAVAMDQRGKGKKVAEAYLDYVRKFPRAKTADDALYRAALNYETDGADKNAARVLETMIKTHGDSPLAPKAYARLASIRERLERYSGAGAMYAKAAAATDSSERSAKLLWQSAAVYQKAENPDAAIVKFERLAEKHPESSYAPKALWNVAETREKLSEQKKAIKAYEQYAKVLPKNANKRRLKAKIRVLALSVPQQATPDTHGEEFPPLQKKLDKYGLDPNHELRHELAEIHFTLTENAVKRIGSPKREIVVKDAFDQWYKSISGVLERDLASLKTIASYGTPTDQVEAYYRVASLIKHAEDTVRKAVSLSKASDDIVAARERAVMDLSSRALQTLEKAYRIAQSEKVATPVRTKTQNLLAKLAPQKYEPATQTASANEQKAPGRNGNYVDTGVGVIYVE